VYTKNARRDLKSLNKEDAIRVASKIKSYSEQKNPLRHAKKLKRPFDDLYRFRIGVYRAIFEIDSRGNVVVITILKVSHRKDIYG